MPPSLESEDGQLQTSTPIKPKLASSAMIVVSNRLPFVLKRDEDGILHRKARYTHHYKPFEANVPLTSIKVHLF